MTGTEKFPEISDADDESEYEEHEEVEFTRAELEVFLRARGGEMTEAQVAIICPIVCGLTFQELNFIMIGICGRTLTDVEWDELMDAQEDDDDETDDETDDEGWIVHSHLPSQEAIEGLQAAAVLSTLKINTILTDDGWSREVSIVVPEQAGIYEI
jgi:hypothetical protein